MAPSTSTAVSTDLPVYLVRGDDPVLTGDAVRELTKQLVGDDDPAFTVEDLAGDDYEIAAVVEAAQTPPFFGDRRGVVGPSIGPVSTPGPAPPLPYLTHPPAPHPPLLVGGGGPIAPRPLGAPQDTG